MSEDLKEALACCNMFSRTTGMSHQIVIDFPSLEAMQKARDVIIKACVPEVREFANSKAISLREQDELDRMTIDEIADAVSRS